jgi:multidrug efflux system outer membrane protein
MNASKVAAGIPADVLSRRPDIRAKEQALRAANAEVGVAIASYFPSISLTGAAGYASPDLRHDVFGRKHGWGIGANLTGPLFQAGRLTANEAAKKEAFLAAKADYEQAVLNALSEVASTLVQRQKLREVITKQEAAVAAYEQSVSLAKQRYKEGYSAYFEVLDNQLRLFPAQKQLANYRYQYAACIPTLYTQLGGGWQK